MTYRQSIYIFPAKYIHIKKVHGVLKVDKLLVTQDREDTVKEPDLFLYTQEMLITILFNTCISLGLINNTQGTAAGIVSDTNNKSSI